MLGFLQFYKKKSLATNTLRNITTAGMFVQDKEEINVSARVSRRHEVNIARGAPK